MAFFAGITFLAFVDRCRLRVATALAVFIAFNVMAMQLVRGLSTLQACARAWTEWFGCGADVVQMMALLVQQAEKRHCCLLPTPGVRHGSAWRLVQQAEKRRCLRHGSAWRLVQQA